MRVRFTPAARDQLRRAVTMIQRGTPAAATAFRRQLETAIKKPEKIAAAARPLPEFPELPQREVLVPPYRIFCRIKGSTVWITGIWHRAGYSVRPDL